MHLHTLSPTLACNRGHSAWGSMLRFRQQAPRNTHPCLAHLPAHACALTPLDASCSPTPYPCPFTTHPPTHPPGGTPRACPLAPRAVCAAQPSEGHHDRCMLLYLLVSAMGPHLASLQVRRADGRVGGWVGGLLYGVHVCMCKEAERIGGGQAGRRAAGRCSVPWVGGLVEP